MHIQTRISPASIASIGSLVVLSVCGCGGVEGSTLEIADEHGSTHMDRVRINLAGMAYDQDSLLKIDLKIAELGCRDTP